MKRCDKCYMDPCICGKMYEKLSSSQLFNLIKSLKDVLDKRHVPGIDIKISGGDIVDPDTSITLEGVLKKANLTNEKLLQYSKYFADAKDMFDDMKDKADKIRSVFSYQSVYICAMFDWFDQSRTRLLRGRLWRLLPAASEVGRSRQCGSLSRRCRLSVRREECRAPSSRPRG